MYYERPEDILQDADIALHQAKDMGKACYVRFEAKMRQRIITRLELENDLRQALENQELQVHYQPIISLESWQIIGFEALMRWKHPRRGFIPPKEFIPIAEETDMIHSLGLWILCQACEQVNYWNKQFKLNPPLTVHVNVSGKQIGKPDFAEKVHQVLMGIGLDPCLLSLEITESLFVENDERFNETLNRLCAMGIKLHIDDFGTGYSSFAYLQRLPVSSIKIDANFVMQMQSSSSHAEIVRSIVSLASNLGMNAIAEGVESADQLTQLTALHCGFGQGFYISEPVPAPVGQQMIFQSRQTGRLSSPDPS
jgi:EAL domain-containing protein (putative c-di-GMP-specific phosphodiesterase class I)